jgi:hypothetical protein
MNDTRRRMPEANKVVRYLIDVSFMASVLSRVRGMIIANNSLEGFIWSLN